MSYKNQMHPSVSKGELQLFRALSLAGLTGGMVTQKTIILKSTIPDFMWAEKRKVIYLDGIHVHSKDKQCNKDSEIDDLLEMQGWEVLRIPYNPPLTDKALEEIIVTVKKFLGFNDNE